MTLTLNIMIILLFKAFLQSTPDPFLTLTLFLPERAAREISDANPNQKISQSVFQGRRYYGTLDRLSERSAASGRSHLGQRISVPRTSLQSPPIFRTAATVGIPCAF